MNICQTSYLTKNTVHLETPKISFGKMERRTPNNDDDSSNRFLEILDVKPISTRKHEWKFGNMGPISTRKHGMAFW